LKYLFSTTAVIEAATGVALLLAPSLVAALLLGASLDAPAGLVVARIAGASLVALAIPCWLARNEELGRAAVSLVSAMLLYNAAAVSILVYASLVMNLSGMGLWPAILVHAAMGIWCVAGLGSTTPVK